MTTHDESFLRAQLAAVEGLLAELPADEQMERIGLESRRDELRIHLQAIEVAAAPAPAVLELTFRGDPVMGSRGIEAGFAAKVVASFKQAVSAIAAGVSGRTLANTGPIPSSDLHRMLITGCAVGSFGFRFEEVVSPDEPRTDEQSAVAQAINQTKEILEGCTKGDEELADALADANPRVLNPIRDFLAVMRTAGATCTIALPTSRFRFENAEEVERALERASLPVNEDFIDVSGVLRGVLPDTRKFDFRLDDGSLLSGKIDREFDDPERLIALVSKSCTGRIRVREVGRVRLVRRYSLTSLEPRQ